MKPSVILSTTVLRGLLLLYPRPFRRRFGAEMLDVFTLRCVEVRGEQGLFGMVRLWARTGPGVARAAFAERAESNHQPSRLPRKVRNPMDRLLQDFRFGLRTLLRSPGFTAVAVITLGLGIGVNTSVFSLVNAFLLRPLPAVEEPERLAVMFTGDDDFMGVSSYMDYLDFEERTEVFDGFAAFKPRLMDFSGEGDTERVQGLMVTGNYFDVLGVRPAHGRFFSAEDDDEPGAETVVVLGHSLWQERFSGDPGVVGGTVLLNGLTFDVIGVAPPDFRGTVLEARPQLFVPMMMQAHFMPESGYLLDRRGWGGIYTVARLAEGVSLEQARADVASVAAWINETHPEMASWGREYLLVPFSRGSLRPGDRGMIVQFSALLLGIMGLVLTVACVNVANLMLTRSVQRRSEIAVRQALGADRRRLFRQLLIESLTLSLIGGAAGVVFAVWSQGFLRALPFPFELDLGLDARVLGFAAAASLVTGIVFGLLPAVRASSVDLAARMRRGAGEGVRRGRRGLADVLVVAQVALSLILLIGAGLFARTLVSLGSMDLGFDAENVLIATVDPGLQGYEGGEIKSFYDRLMPRIEAAPGVERASLISAPPGPMNDNYWTFSIEGYTPEADQRIGGYISYAATGYFETMGIPVVEGRAFAGSDTEGAPVVVINETGARRFAELTGREALGARLGFEGPEGPFAEIIGIVADSTVGGLRDEARQQLYLPHEQITAAGMGARMSLLVRTGAADPLSVVAGVRAAVLETDPNVPVFAATTLEEHLSATLVQERLSATLLAFSAALSLLLASVGLYGVLSYAVARRTREMGIRMALGAQTEDVRRMVVRQGMVLVAVGGAFGLAASWFGASLVSSFLFGVTNTDPVTYAAVTALLVVVALISAYVPARRATRVDPITALRSE